MKSFPKPTIAMRKFNEAEFVNVRTYWSLTSTAVHDEATLELQVRHNGLGDSFRFVSHDAAQRDELELITADELNARIMQIREHEDMSHQDAVDFLSGKVLVMSSYEEQVREHLVRTWDAFALLFEPAYNL